VIVPLPAPIATLPTVDETADLLRCSRRRVFELIAEGTLVRGPRYGRRTVVTLESIEAALAVGTDARGGKRCAVRRRVRTAKSLKADLDALAAQQRSEWKKGRVRPNSRFESRESV
jgi:hypothetical protein